MDFRENLRLAWSCVRSNRMRSFLTMLGIIIGISAVITITTIGSSLKQSIATSVYEMAGVNTLYAYISSDDYRGEYDCGGGRYGKQGKDSLLLHHWCVSGLSGVGVHPE